jgi:multidrug efflux pump subunit AcrA (membrane-fusion protein)
VARATALALVGLLGGAIAWASLGQVDIISAAPGRLLAAGGGKVVQPLEPGTIAAIRVRPCSNRRADREELHGRPFTTETDFQP